jgi:asparagine synthase (glutamine-hydrolysing)
MLEAQAHRGPDDWGLLVPDALVGAERFARLFEGGRREHLRRYAGGGRPGVVLGARRLSILDLSSHGRMPMGSGDSGRWVAHNGEIYNFRELRDDLGSAGAPFRSGSDTEVILRGYATWGDDVVRRLRGMFAFAIFEAAPRPRLLLARDRLGIKPIYYHRDRERLVFASEVRALRCSGLVPEEPNPEAIARFLQLGSVPSPITTVKDLVSLPPAHCLTVEEGAVPGPRRYWSLADVAAHRPVSGILGRLGDAAERTGALLEESVGLHLASDVPLGVFLSGGIDSSALVAVASRTRETPLTTLSVVFDERAYSEAPYARRVAERYRTDHREITVRSRDFFEAMPRYFRAMDEPTVDGVNTYLVSEQARRAGVTVVLSGTGGDELFLGYEHHRRWASLDRVRRMLGAVPGAPRRALLRFGARAGTAMGRGGLEKLEYLERSSVAAVYMAVRGLFGPRRVQDLLGISRGELEAYGSPLPDTERPAAAEALQFFEFAHYLQNQLLKDIDVMSMAHSVETRVPFLDHRLVEHVLGLPVEARLAGGAHKPLLIRALGDALPREVWDRPKMGFTFPLGPWLRQRADELRAVCLEGTLLERKAVEAVWDEFVGGRLHWSRAWALVVLARFAAGRKMRAA